MLVYNFVYQVVPPAEWKPRRGGYDDIGSMEISTPISQFVSGQQGVYQLYNIQKKPISVTEFIEMANSDRLVCPYGKCFHTKCRTYSFCNLLLGLLITCIKGSVYSNSMW